MKDMDELLGLETRRQELHDAILEDAGFDRNDTSEDAREFKNALSDYVDKLAGTIIEVPVDNEMSADEIADKRKQSEGIMKYMDDMNIRMAKQRGLI
jgi:uncharacterized protein Smg (DUF494 family)